MATRVRKTPAVAPTEPPVDSAAVVTTRRRATTSRTAATRRVASSSRSQRILVGTDLSPSDRPPVAETDDAATPQPDTSALLVKESGGTDSAALAPVVGIPLPDVRTAATVSDSVPPEPTVATVSAAAVVGTDAVVDSVDVASVARKLGELHQLLAEGHERLSQEISKSQSQTVRNVSGLAHDVDRLMTQIQGLVVRVNQTETMLSRIEATLVPLARGISATLLPVKGIEKPVSAETLERGLATALAPLLAELIEMRAQRSRDSSLAQVEQQILLTELRRLRSVALPSAERTTNPLLAVGKVPRRSSSK